MRWLIVGAGALGSIMAAHLSRAGEDVSLLARGARAAFLKQNGLTVHGLADVSTPVRVLDDPAQATETDVLVLTVKTYDTLSALESLRHVRTKMAFSVQNGVVKDDQLAAVFGKEAVLGATADFSGEVLADGVVQFTRNEGLYLGELPSGVSQRVLDVTAIFDGAGIRTEARDAVLAVEWSKLVGWLALTPLAVLTRLVTYKVLQDPDLARLQSTIAHEAAQIPQTLGIELEDLFVQSPARRLISMSAEEWVEEARTLGQTMEERGVTSHKMSALQDLERGRRMEVEETFGDAVSRAREMGLAVPALEACYRLMAGAGRASL